ncbi:hypothetical protein [Nocardia brevicatena]|uniref:hypothetical protein n=1 Tax=Nocardia brevicatena TaxID=37327 RepID=UPI001C3F49D4|nr:hypothetical protein [Nocardia brevicatena]
MAATTSAERQSPIAREVFKSLSRGLAAPDLDDLRPTRQAKNIPLTAAAAAIGTYISKLARTELGTTPTANSPNAIGHGSPQPDTQLDTNRSINPAPRCRTFGTSGTASRPGPEPVCAVRR